MGTDKPLTQTTEESKVFRHGYKVMVLENRSVQIVRSEHWRYNVNDTVWINPVTERIAPADSNGMLAVITEKYINTHP